MPITEEQRQRAEANRLAALEKRKVYAESIINKQQHEQQNQNPWRLFKCRKLSSNHTHCSKPPPVTSVNSDPNAFSAQKFLARLEICSPDTFSITPEAIKGFAYPGEDECLRILGVCLSEVMSSHYTQIHGGGTACVYKLRDYDAVLMCLKNYKCIEIQKIPFTTLNIVQKLSHIGRWEPLRPEHLTEAKVDELICKLPNTLVDALLPFQLEGLRFGLQRGGRCLIADEMGLGKTLQAIAIAGCFIDQGPILVVCPAILRFSWAEELERWLPFCLPSEIHLVFGHQTNPANLTRCPRVVVTSYTMLQHLRTSMLEREWALLIVDESHHLRCSKKKSEPKEIKAVLDIAARIKRIVLLSGTPSLSRPYDIFHQINMLWPGLLGQNKYDFAKAYCAVRYVHTSEGKSFQDFSRGVRLEELNVLLRQTVMIRRLKEHVLEQLPPKRRQIIRLFLKRSDIIYAKSAMALVDGNAVEATDLRNPVEPDDGRDCCTSRQLSYQEVGIAKLPGFREWLSIHPVMFEPNGKEELDVNPGSQKMIIFAHHHKVLDGVQEFMCEKGVGFVRIDGTTLARDRQIAVQSFQSSNEIKIAIIGITAGGVGLDFSSARNVVFLELPQSPSLMLQAEDRAHRRGQTNAVNIYIFNAKDTIDERYWQTLNKSLHRVSSTTNGKYDAVTEIMVDSVSDLETFNRTERNSEDQVLEKGSRDVVSTVEIVKLQDSGLERDSESFEVHDETAGEFIGRSGLGDSGVHTNCHHCEASMVLDVRADKVVVANENKEGSVYTIRTGWKNNTIVSSNLDEGNGSKIQLEQENTISPQIAETDDGGPVQPSDDKYLSEVYSLRFEVSKYTERIHLYSCTLGTESRPQPLFVNFRPEELESIGSPVENNGKEAASKFLKDNPAYRDALFSFLNEWNALRPVDKRKLRGKTLQLPLSIELCCLNESVSHNSMGMLKKGSKRRTTPLNEISHPLPSNAVLKMVYLSSSYGKKDKQYAQGWTLMDEPLCKLCQTPCRGRNAKTPEYFEDLFCSLDCYEEYRIRTSSRSLRQELFQVEHGICTNCHLDCHTLVKTIKPLPLDRRREYVEKIAPNVASRTKLLDKLVNDPSEGNAWHADHIVPVYRGGGECRLENMRTLCVACHFDVTAAQRSERRLAMARARKQLAVIMSDLKHDKNVEGATSKVQGHPQMQEDATEDELLLVKVPGSAYSGAEKTD